MRTKQCRHTTQVLHAHTHTSSRRKHTDCNLHFAPYARGLSQIGEETTFARSAQPRVLPAEITFYPTLPGAVISSQQKPQPTPPHTHTHPAFCESAEEGKSENLEQTRLLPAALGQSPPTRAAEYGYTRTTLTADCSTGSTVRAQRSFH